MSKGVNLKDEEIEFLKTLVEARAKELCNYTDQEDAINLLSDALRIKVYNILERVVRKSYAQGELDGYNSCDCW